MADQPTAAAAEEAPKATPVFGSASTFGAATGFAGFTGVPAASSSAAPAAEASGEGAEDGDGEVAPEEECQAEFKPVVQLEEVETSTGEEGEEALLELKCKLYRFDTENNEWKERGVGFVRLLKHKENKKIRLLMRQEKTHKLRANHLVMPGTQLQEHTGSDKAWVWSTVDFAEGERKVEMFCIRFGSTEKAGDFKAKFNEAADSNAEVISASVPIMTKEEEETGADELAKEVQQKAKVEDGAEAQAAQ